MLFSLLQDLTSFASDTLTDLLRGSFPSPKPFNAQFIKPSKLLKGKYKGFCLDGSRKLPLEDSFKNALIVGGTGSGKTSTIIVPSILKMALHGHSLIVHDPSMEIEALTGGFLKEKDYKVKVLRYDKSGWSEGYNPLLRIKGESDIGQFSQALISTGLGAKQSDPFWENQAKQLLALLLGLLQQQDKAVQHMASLIDLLNTFSSTPEKIQKLLKGIQQAQQEFNAFMRMSDKVLSGTIATAKAALSMFHNKDIQAITSFDTLELEQLRHQAIAIFIQNPILSQDFFAPLTSLFFRQLFEHLFNEIPDDKTRSVFCLIDEAATFKADFPLYLAQVRKYRAGILLALQSFTQLQALYSPFEATTIAANCHAKIYFTNADHNQTKALSEMMGSHVVKDMKGDLHKALLSPQEIRMLPKNRALLFLGNHHPALLRLKPYYSSRLRKKLRPTLARHQKMPYSRIPRLDL